MSKKMLINALHAEEARVAIVEDGRLVELDVEIAGSEQIRGNIYRGVVVRVEPGLQAAFVDIGLKKLGFLQMGEIHPDNWRWRDDIPEDQRHRRPRIQEILRRGQELLVQVEKGERDNKGSALTSYVSLPGRYMVLMPGSDSAGISRKVESESERKKLKEIISEMSIPGGYGYIIRTEAVGRTRDELQRDLDSLISLYEGVKSQGAAGKGPGLIYQESALIVRTIRDYFSSDIDEVLVDSKDVFKDVREALKEIDPQFEKLVKLHQEKRPIFSRYQLEEQIDLIYEKKVPLKSGGSIFIEPTEALVSIDVNSGKSTGEKGVEDTAFKTNMEAAEEAARQLRLRDLGGLIVIDFIDMRDRKHNAEVEKTLKTALKADKARVNVARISEFGLLEMSRQRIRQTLHQASTLECPHCDGRGKVKSVEAMAVSFLRKIHAAAAKGTIAEVMGSLPLEVAYFVLNRKRHELSRIENDYDIQVTVKGKPSYLLNQMELELVKREKLPQEELPQEKVAVQPQQAIPQEAAAAEGRKKRKRGKKGQPEAAVTPSPTEGEAPAMPLLPVHETVPGLPEGAPSYQSAVTAEMAAAGGAEGTPVALAVESTGAEGVVTAEGEHEEHKKKRRRKRRRGKGGAAEGAAEHAPGEAVEVTVDLPAAAMEGAAEMPAGAPAEHPEGVVPEHGAEHGEEVKKKRRRKRRRGKGGHEAGHEAAAATEGAAEAPAEGAEGGVVLPEGYMPPEGPTQLEAMPVAPVTAEPGTEGVAAASSEPQEQAPQEEKPKRAKRPRAKKAPAEAAAEMPEVAPASIEPAAPAAAPAEGRQEAPAAASWEVVGIPEVAAPAAVTQAAHQEAPAPAATEAPAAAEPQKPKRKRAPRAPKTPEAAEGEAAGVKAVTAAPEAAAAPAKKRTTRPKAAATADEGGAPAEAGAEEKPKKRPGRKKKAESQGENQGEQ
jgi:ribonuclease E